MKKKLIGYALVYKNRDSFVIINKEFFKNKNGLSEAMKEDSQALKKKVFIKKVYYSF